MGWDDNFPVVSAEIPRAISRPGRVYGGPPSNDALVSRFYRQRAAGDRDAWITFQDLVDRVSTHQGNWIWWRVRDLVGDDLSGVPGDPAMLMPWLEDQVVAAHRGEFPGAEHWAPYWFAKPCACPVCRRARGEGE